jgi:hypothetical protein
MLGYVGHVRSIFALALEGLSVGAGSVYAHEAMMINGSCWDSSFLLEKCILLYTFKKDIQVIHVNHHYIIDWICWVPS